ncbi:MAG: hypothetical protein PVI00_13030 [Desulfobacterales bacterium]
MKIKPFFRLLASQNLPENNLDGKLEAFFTSIERKQNEKQG